jgi:hypothetical protein
MNQMVICIHAMIPWYDFIPSCRMRRGRVNTISSGFRRNVHANGRVLVGLGREWCGSHPGKVPSDPCVRCRPCTAAVSQVEGELKQIWRPPRSNPTSCAQVSKRSVPCIEALIVLSPYGRPSRPLRLAKYRQGSQTNTSRAVWSTLSSFRTSCSRHTWEARLASSSKLIASSDERHLRRTKKLLPQQQAADAAEAVVFAAAAARTNKSRFK